MSYPWGMATRKMVLDVAGREVSVSNPEKVYFPRTGHTKLDLIRYYLAVAEGALRGVAERPMALKRFVNGAEGEFFFQKRAPEKRPEWVETVELKFPSGRSAHEVVVRDAAQLAWVVNLGCIDLNPHPVRAGDLDHPDELRVDLDPMPGVPWSEVLQVALQTREVLEDFGLVGWPKTSGSRGFHVYCRIERRWIRTLTCIPREPEVLGQPRSPCSSRTSRTSSVIRRTKSQLTPGPGSRSTRNSSGCSRSSARTGCGFKSMHPRFTIHSSCAASRTTISRAVRPDGKRSSTVSIHSGRCSGPASGRTAHPRRPST